MKKCLNKIRVPAQALGRKQKVIIAVVILIFGITLGVFSKWLDVLAINDAISWQRFLGILDLRNIFSEFPVWALFATTVAVFSENPKRAAYHVFIFFAGMTVSYHLYSIYIGGFDPKTYMMLWYGITLLSPLLAVVCWYAKGIGKSALLLKVLILTFFMLFSFYVGPGYFDFGKGANLLFLLLAIAVLWQNWKVTGLSVLCAFVLRVSMGMLRHFQ